MTWIPELPLLRRELTELANRRRTYIVRVIGAVVILFFTFSAYQQVMSARLSDNFVNPANIATQFLGVGGEIFKDITPKLFFAIQLLMPALCCAAVTSEKESNTFGTLLLTRLSPSVIVAEKFLSRLVPMLTLLALTFPILAHVYSLGGVDTGELLGTLWLLFAECLLFASISILCSSWFSTTVTAFTVSYMITGLLTVLSLSFHFNTFVPSAVWHSCAHMRPREPNSTTTFLFQFYLSKLKLVNSAGRLPNWAWMFTGSLSSLVITFALLAVARAVLVKRAFVTQSSVVMKFFRGMDTFFKTINDRTTGGIMIVDEKNYVPAEDPVVWREQNKKSLGKLRYLIRVLVALEFPTLLICAYAAIDSAQIGYDGLYSLQMVVWILAAVVTMVKGATLFTSERANQTIEPLLASPMTTVEIVDQKIQGMRRLLIVLAVPVLTVNFTHMLLGLSSSTDETFGFAWMRAVVYFGLSLYGCFVLLRMGAWMSLAVGLKVHSQTKAVLTCFALLGIWIIVPRLGEHYLSPSNHAVISKLSPVSVPYALEEFLNNGQPRHHYGYSRHAPETSPYLLQAMTTLLFYSVAGFLVRYFVRKSACRMLQRLDTQNVTAAELLIDDTNENTDLRKSPW